MDRASGRGRLCYFRRPVDGRRRERVVRLITPELGYSGRLLGGAFGGLRRFKLRRFLVKKNTRRPPVQRGTASARAAAAVLLSKKNRMGKQSQRAKPPRDGDDAARATSTRAEDAFELLADTVAAAVDAVGLAAHAGGLFFGLGLVAAHAAARRGLWAAACAWCVCNWTFSGRRPARAAAAAALAAALSVAESDNLSPSVARRGDGGRLAPPARAGAGGRGLRRRAQRRRARARGGRGPGHRRRAAATNGRGGRRPPRRARARTTRSRRRRRA